MRVRLVVTGKAELLGLARSLHSLWPSHTFETVPMRRSPDGSVVPFDGFTSSRLPLPAGRAPANLDKLVEALAAEVCPGRRGAPADLAVLLDDLELENVDQPDVVLGCVRDAVYRHLSGLQGSLANRTAEALRARASFHLAVPMLETWFFGDPSALLAAGVPDHRLPARLRHGADPETFETDDSAFSLDDGSDCPGAHDRTGPAQRRVSPGSSESAQIVPRSAVSDTPKPTFSGSAGARMTQDATPTASRSAAWLRSRACGGESS